MSPKNKSTPVESIKYIIRLLFICPTDNCVLDIQSPFASAQTFARKTLTHMQNMFYAE
jgi:hypothetical protein